VVSAAGFEPATHALKVLSPSEYATTPKKSEYYGRAVFMRVWTMFAAVHLISSDAEEYGQTRAGMTPVTTQGTTQIFV
jgi:hypothetical protein